MVICMDSRRVLGKQCEPAVIRCGDSPAEGMFVGVSLCKILEKPALPTGDYRHVLMSSLINYRVAYYQDPLWGTPVKDYGKSNLQQNLD